MLHNGKQMLGVVDERECKAIHALFSHWKAEKGIDNVIVCQTWAMPPRYEDLDSIQVRGMSRVNERLARKFSDITRKA